jgi:hypothetical protein
VSYNDENLPYKAGDRVELQHMVGDPYPIPVGAQGTVRDCRWIEAFNQWHVDVDWDSGRTLKVLFPPDRILKLANCHLVK